MVAPNISASDRFIPEGTTAFYWVVTMASYLAPSRAELNAGTNLTPEVESSGNWGIVSNAVGFIVKFPGGDITGRRMTVFPCKVGSAAEPTAFGAPTVLNFSYYVTRI